MDTLSVALWATNLEYPTPSLAAWVDGVAGQLAEAQAGGAGLLVLPEFACAQWLSFAPPGLPANQQVAWLASLTADALAAITPLAAHYGVAVLPGTLPFAVPDEASGGVRYLNRAWLLTPDGARFAQDKLCLTPSEQNPQGWLLSPGDTVNVIEWAGLRIAIVVCLDVEFTALWARLAQLDLDLIVIPAKTDMASGYYRVFGCAKARAIELQTVVCAVGAIGSPLGHPAVDTVVGGAAAFIPCEAALGNTGVAAALEPQSAAGGVSPLLLAPQLPVGFCRNLRHGAAEAEVWPGSWPADRITITEAVPTGPDGQPAFPAASG